MTNEEKKYASKLLINSYRLISSDDDPRYLPKIFIVNGKCYFFLNVARRAAFGTNYPIEVLTIEEAWETYTHPKAGLLKKECIERGFDQTGETFNGFLFENSNILANMVSNKIILA